MEGIWHVTFNADEVPADDQYSPIEVVATDIIGNVSRTKTDRVLIDTQAPNVASIREMDSLLSAADQLNSLMVKGSAETGSTVVLTVEGETTQARASTGRWIAQFTANQLASINAAAQNNGGASTLQVQVFDQLGNPSAVLNRSLLLDTVAPDAPSFDLPTGSFVNSSARVDGFTLSGQAEPLSKLELRWEAFTSVVDVDSNGLWSHHFRPEQIPADSPLSSLITSLRRCWQSLA